MSVERELAIHGNEIKHIQEDMDRMVKDIDEIKQSIANIQKTLDEAKGGWRTLMWAAGAGGAVATFLFSIYNFFWGK